MTALADAFLALMPFAEEWRDGDPALTARETLRKHAPCEECGGDGQGRERCGPYMQSVECSSCSGAGWTPASVETRIAREEEQASLEAAVIAAAKDVERWGGPGHPLLKNLTPALDRLSDFAARERQPR